MTKPPTRGFPFDFAASTFALQQTNCPRRQSSNLQFLRLGLSTNPFPSPHRHSRAQLPPRPLGTISALSIRTPLTPVMANRQITRRIAISAAISILLVFFLFIRPQGPPSPAIRAPGHITHNAASPGITIQEDTLKGDVVMPKLGNATAKYVPAMIGLG